VEGGDSGLLPNIIAVFAGKPKEQRQSCRIGIKLVNFKQTPGKEVNVMSSVSQLD
jgi:hypothetical protein